MKKKKLASDRGFGFIETELGDVFFHLSSVNNADFESLVEGQSVEYEIEQGPKGPRANSISPLQQLTLRTIRSTALLSAGVG